jgi:tRNA A-37 threonylcarbamoyl transferase component Bud32
MSVEVHRIIAEERQWERAVGHVFAGSTPLLLAVSRYIADSRVYLGGNTLAKIRRVGVLRPRGVHTLEEEAHIYEALRKPCRYEKRQEWEILTTPATPVGSTLADIRFDLGARELRITLGKVGRRIGELHRRGVAHCDLRLDNIVVSPDGRVDLVDFDRAVTGKRHWMAAVDWLGIGRDGAVAATPFWKLLLHAYLPKSQGLTSRVRAFLRGPEPILLRSPTSPAIAGLAKAWTIAQRSQANSPGHSLAYYAFSFQGEHFPGERPWYLRWEPLRRQVDWSGKRVLELGCNMGLLSAFVRIYGAAAATAVDRDWSILEAGQVLCEALAIDGVDFRRADLSSMSWEKDMPEADICVAMSLHHWLPGPGQAALLRFLARHREVVFEGHDPLSTEIDRLRRVGFDVVNVLAVTERRRHVLLARKG